MPSDGTTPRQSCGIRERTVEGRTMVQLAEDLYHEVSAEAVFLISNRTLTRKVIAELRKRGVAAYAPVFDS